MSSEALFDKSEDTWVYEIKEIYVMHDDKVFVC